VNKKIGKKGKGALWGSSRAGPKWLTPKKQVQVQFFTCKEKETAGG